MKDKWAGNIRYIEVCSGPGRCCTRDKHEQDGTALAVLKHPLFRHHKHALFFDFSENVITTLSRRIDALGLSQRAHAILGDFNKPDTITSAMRYYGAGCLTLCLIDPTECNLPFETVRQIYEASGRKCDFIISFFEQNDFNRNGCDAVTNPSFIHGLQIPPSSRLRRAAEGICKRFSATRPCGTACSRHDKPPDGMPTGTARTHSAGRPTRFLARPFPASRRSCAPSSP